MKWEKEMEFLQAAFAASQPMRQAWVAFEPSGQRICVEVAETSEQRAAGMVGRSFTDDVSAMLFVEPVETYAKFHMRNVNFPLVLAIFDSAGVFLDSIHMPAESTSVVHAHGFRYALEMAPEIFAALELVGQTFSLEG